MTTDAVRIDLVQLGRKTCMLPVALQRKDIDARHQGMTCCMTLRAVYPGMHGRLLPEGGSLLLMMARHAEFLLGSRIGRKGDGRIKHENDQGSAQGPYPDRKMWNLRNIKFQRPILLRDYSFVNNPGTPTFFPMELMVLPMSNEMGMMVLFFSPAISVSVWRYRN